MTARDDRGEAGAMWAAFFVMAVLVGGFVLVSMGPGQEDGDGGARARAGFPVAVEPVLVDGGAWLELTLTSGELSPAWGVNVSIDVFDPDGGQHRTVCVTAELSGGECARPFGPNMAWRKGGQLWVPCQGEGQHTVTVVINDRLQAQRSRGCLAVVE